VRMPPIEKTYATVRFTLIECKNRLFFLKKSLFFTKLF
jgi:hypothetical protein